MDKMEPSAAKKSFDEIVKYNNFNRDVLVPVIAAEDTLVRSTISYIESSNMPPRSEEYIERVYEDLEKHVVRRYSLPADLSEMVFKLCGDMIWRGDFEHGEA
jgi:hypothetical protein